MSSVILQGISTLLEAKSHDKNIMNRGVTVKDLATALGFPHTSVNAALRNELEAARFGIYKLTPNRQRYVLWAYSESVAEKALATPFGDSTGIDPKVQAAEVRQLVSDCVEPKDHETIAKLKDAADKFREEFGLSEEFDVIGTALSKYWAQLEEEKNNASE